MSTTITQRKLIDELVVLRKEFIDVNVQSVFMHKKAIKLSQTINNLIPSKNAGYIDVFDTVFYSISSMLGENVRNRVRPKESSIMALSDTDIRLLVTRAVDNCLWNMVMNRLGIFKSMSRVQIMTFKHDSCTNPAPFTLDVITETLLNIATNQQEIMIDALYDTFNDLNSTYVSNKVNMFGKKVIIESAFLTYGDTFKLKSHDNLSVLIEVVWRWVLINKWEVTELGTNENQIWEELSKSMELSLGDYDEIKSIVCCGIEFRFFKNKNVHILFPTSMISILNSQLAKKNYIAK